MAPRATPVDGLLAIDKDSGPSSHGVVASVRRILGQRRVGHCGTLDPLATGLLLMCLGRHTRLAEFLSASDKEYRTLCRLGVTSDTYDIQGRMETARPDLVPSLRDVEAHLERFRGDITQVPPAFSAVRIKGVRSYQLAREGKRPVPAERRVTVHAIEVVAYEFPLLTLRVKCSKGTYVRTLAHDLGRQLGCGAVVQQLRRIRSGAIDEQRMISLQQLEEAVQAGMLESCLIPVNEALPHLANVVLSTDELQRFSRGQELSADGGVSGTCLVSGEDGDFWGIARVSSDSACIRPWKVIAPSGRQCVL